MPTKTTCKVCGGEVTAKDPERYPYCRTCHYTGFAAQDLRADQLNRFRAAFPDALVVIEHTGGGCFWLAIRFVNEPKYYVLTDGEASLPDKGKAHDYEPLAEGGWGYIGRHDDTEPGEGDDWKDARFADYDGTPLKAFSEPNWPKEMPSEEAWFADYPAYALSDAEAIAIVKADRKANAPERVNGCPVVGTVNGCKIIDHPQGFMVYRGFRLGTYKTFKSAVRKAENS